MIIRLDLLYVLFLPSQSSRFGLALTFDSLSRLFCFVREPPTLPSLCQLPKSSHPDGVSLQLRRNRLPSLRTEVVRSSEEEEEEEGSAEELPLEERRS